MKSYQNQIFVCLLTESCIFPFAISQTFYSLMGLESEAVDLNRKEEWIDTARQFNLKCTESSGQIKIIDLQSIVWATNKQPVILCTEGSTSV